MRCARCPRGEVVTYGELAALAGHPGAARAAGTFCARCELAPFLPVHRVVSGERHRQLGRAGRRRTSAGCWSSRRTLDSLTTSATSSRRSLRRGAAAAWPSSRRSSTASGAWHLRDRHRRGAPRPRQLRDRPARVRASARPRAFARRSVPTRAGTRSTRRRATSCTSTSTSTRSTCCARRACSLRPARRSRRRRSASSGARAAAARTCAARCSARGRSPARATPISSCAPAGSTARDSSPTSRHARRACSDVAERRAHAVAYAKGHEAIADVLALAGAGDTALAARGARVLACDSRRCEPACERRRGEPGAGRPRSAPAARGDSATIGARRAAAGARRDRRAPPPAPVCVARASSPPRRGRRSRKRPPSVGCEPSRDSSKPSVASLATALANGMTCVPILMTLAEPGLGRRWIQTPSTVVVVIPVNRREGRPRSLPPGPPDRPAARSPDAHIPVSDS